MNDALAADGRSKIRVAHIKTDWLPLSENWLYWLVTRTPRTIQNYLLCERTLNLDQFSVDDLHVILKSSGSRLVARIPMLRRRLRCYAYARIARRFSPHLIHSHFGVTGWQNLMLARDLRTPHVVSFYGIDVSLPERRASWRVRYREMFDQVDAVLCEGPHMAERIIALGAQREQMRLYRLGIEFDHLPYHPRKWTGAEPLRVLIAGRFVEKKGIPYAINALARIASRVPLEIHLVGNDNASVQVNAEQERIINAIARGSLNNRIVDHGLIPYTALIKLAYQCHVFLSPSVHAADGDSEGGAPMTIAEMAATGMPIVSTTHCDIPYAVGGKENAMLAPERDADALAELLSKLIDDPNGWRPMLDRARTHVEQSYNISRQGEALAQIYRQIISPSRR